MSGEEAGFRACRRGALTTRGETKIRVCPRSEARKEAARGVPPLLGSRREDTPCDENDARRADEEGAAQTSHPSRGEDRREGGERHGDGEVCLAMVSK